MININLLPPEYKAESLGFGKLLCFAAIGAVVLLAALAYAYGLYKVNVLTAEIEKAQTAYHLLAETVERQKNIDNQQRLIQVKNDVLVHKSKENTSCYAIMVHLGSLITDGVRLQEIILNDSALTIKGCMEDYPHLIKFIEKFEGDTLLGSAELENATAAEKQGDLAVFALTTKFKDEK